MTLRKRMTYTTASHQEVNHEFGFPFEELSHVPKRPKIRFFFSLNVGLSKEFWHQCVVTFFFLSPVFSGWYVLQERQKIVSAIHHVTLSALFFFFFYVQAWEEKTWWLRSIPGHLKYIPGRNICRLSRCFDLPSIVSNHNQQNSLYKVLPLCVTSWSL